MARERIEAATCDRCGHREELKTKEAEYAWGQIAYRQINGPRWVATKPGGNNTDRADICPKCLTELHNWWTNPSNPENPCV